MNDKNNERHFVSFPQTLPTNIRDLTKSIIGLLGYNLNNSQKNILYDLIDGLSIKEIAEKNKRKESSIENTIKESIKIINIRLTGDAKKLLLPNNYVQQLKKQTVSNLQTIDNLNEDIKKLKSNIANKDAEITELRALLNKIMKQSLRDRSLFFFNEVKESNLELSTKIKVQNDIIKSLQKQISLIRRENLYYDFLEQHYDIQEDLYKKIQIGQLLDTKISEFDLSTRALNIARKLNIKTLSDLTSLSKSDLSNVEGCGKNTVEEFEDLLDQYLLSFDRKEDKDIVKLYQKYKSIKDEFEKKIPYRAN